MNIIRRVFQALRESWPGGLPKSLLMLAKERRSRTKLKTSNLYVIEADFEVSPDAYDHLQAHLDVIREKYGLDFLIVEPGFKLKRFDDF